MSVPLNIASSISAHCWSPDRKQIALSPNDENVLIYSNADNPDTSKWKLEHTLRRHDLVVCGIDWSPVHNKIVTCSHDRNAFVWTFDKGEWQPSLSILRINRAALSVKWSPDGKKFAVASGAKVVPVCHYEADNDWWISKMIKKHKSTVLDVSWHPNSQILATASTDFKCRVFSAFIEAVDKPVDSQFGNTGSFELGTVLAEFEQSLGWVEGVSFSPDGTKLAFVGHDSSLNIATFPSSPGSGSPVVQTIKAPTLPSTKVLFLSDTVFVTAGYDYNPQIYQDSGKGKFELLGKAEEKASEKSSGKSEKKSAFSSARTLWANKTTKGQESSDADSADIWTSHKNAITGLVPYGDTQWSTAVDAFSTCGLDGNIVIWRARDLKTHLKNLKL